MTIHLVFLPREIIMNKTNFLLRCIIGNIYIFSPFGSNQDTLHKFFMLMLLSGCFSCCLQCNIPVAGFSLKIEVGGRNKKVEGGSEGLAYS